MEEFVTEQYSLMFVSAIYCSLCFLVFANLYKSVSHWKQQQM